MNWKRLLAYITGSVDQELLLRNEYLVRENRIFKNQIKGRLQLTLQRHFESFPFFEFIKATFTMGLIGLVVALLMIAHAF
jgi:hypothetical protein